MRAGKTWAIVIDMSHQTGKNSPLPVQRWVLSPVPAVRVARATTSRSGWRRGLRPVTVPVTAAVWYLRLAWYGGTTGVLTRGRAVLAVSGPPQNQSRPQRVRGFAASTVAAMLLSVTVVALMVAVYALTALVSIPAATQVLTGIATALVLVLLAGGLYCVVRWVLPHGRLDALAAALTPADGWQLKTVAATGTTAAQEEADLLAAFLDYATQQRRPVVAGVVRVHNRSQLENTQMVRVEVPGASRRWPPLLVAGPLPPPPPDTPTVRRQWTVLAGFGLVISGLAAIVAFVAVYVVLPAEQATNHCRGADPSGCITRPSEALYWAITTLTTTGYGDFSPHSTTGRITAAGLMLTGVIIVAGLLTSLVVSTLIRSVEREQQLTDFLRSQTTPDPAPQPQGPTGRDATQLHELEALLRELLKQHSGNSSPAPPPAPPVTAPTWPLCLTLAGVAFVAAWARARTKISSK